MRFVYDLTVPAATTVEIPERKDVSLFKGTLTNAGVWFRAGPHNLVSVVVLDKQLQFIPSAVGKAIIGDNVIYMIPMNYMIDSEPFDLSLFGWSPDTKYPHTITFFFDITPAEGSEKNALQELIKVLIPQGR